MAARGKDARGIAKSASAHRANTYYQANRRISEWVREQNVQVIVFGIARADGYKNRRPLDREKHVLETRQRRRNKTAAFYFFAGFDCGRLISAQGKENRLIANWLGRSIWIFPFLAYVVSAIAQGEPV